MQNPSSDITKYGTLHVDSQPGVEFDIKDGQVSLQFAGAVGLHILNAVIAEAVALREDFKAIL